MKTLKICLGILCLLPYLAIGTPQSIGANPFMELTLYYLKHTPFIVKIDDEDYDLIKNYKWIVRKSRNVFYAQTWINKNGIETTKSMHRIIMNAKPGDIIDHINTDGLDNRKTNLRICSNKQNCWNKNRAQNNTTGYKGVTYREKNKKYVARITHNCELIYLGFYSSAEEAAKAYNKAAIRLYGEFANLNKV